MSKPLNDVQSHRTNGGTAPLCIDGIDLPDAPPPSPNGRIVYEHMGIHIDHEGGWHYHGSPIRRKELVCLFASALMRDGDGRHWLVTPAEMGPIDVDDAPFLAVEMFIAGNGAEQCISFRTNIDEIVTIDDEHPLRLGEATQTGETVPYVVLRRRLEARLTRAVYYDLVELATETEIDGQKCYAVWSRGRQFPLSWIDEAA